MCRFSCGLASRALALLLLFATTASGELIRIDIRRRQSFGTYERLIGRAYFAVDPASAANRGIADLSLAPRNAQGLVEFSGDVLFFRPTSPGRFNGTVFFEIVNRGRDQSLGLMSGAEQSDLAPEHWQLGDRFVLEHGFALAFLGWQFDVRPEQGLTFQTPVAPVQGSVRASYVATGGQDGPPAFALTYCASNTGQASAVLTFRSAIDGPSSVVSRKSWAFGPGGCSVQLPMGVKAGLYEVVYGAAGSPVAGLGLAAVRDFASYLRYGGADAALRIDRALSPRVIGFGYSQSGRFLRELVRDGFNEDEHGRAAFDGMMIASAGAGGGSFNHRFAMPGQAGNSVLSILRPVDVPPFADDGLLVRAKAAGVVPRIFYTFSSTEYWARAGSLTQTTDDGTADVPFAATSRLYFLSGTPHAGGPMPPARPANFRYSLNFADQRWALRALLLDLDAWIRAGVEPPPSRYPTVASGQLVRREDVHFPGVRSLPFPSYMPQVWPIDFGAAYEASRIITNEPPLIGRPYAVRVPQVDADGNDLGGIRLVEVAVPLGTYTGWNVSVPQLGDLHYLAGLAGSFEPFARTQARREKAGDARPSIAERYKSRAAYLERVAEAAQALVRERFLLADDLPAIMRRAEAMWKAIVD